MVDALQLVSLTYGIFGGLYFVSREVSFARWVRLRGTQIKYGFNPATVHEKESIMYFRVITMALTMGGIAFAIVSQFASHSNFLPVFLVNMPFLICVLVIGFDSHVIDINGLVGVYPKGSGRRFLVEFLFAFAYPLVAGIGLVIAGYIPLNSTPVLSSIFFIPLVVLAFTLFGPWATGEWLFGNSSFVDSLPSAMKSFVFRTYMPIMLALVWSQVVNGNFPLLVVGFAICFLLALGLRRISDDKSY